MARGSRTAGASGGWPGGVGRTRTALRCRRRTATPPTVRIIEGGVCVPLSETMRSTAHRGLLTWGNDDDGADQLLVGTYARASQVGHHLTEQLRDITVPPPGSVDETLLALLRSELADPKPGHSLVIDRLLDVVVASVIRAAAPLAGPGWLSGTVDPTVAGALDLMHESPEKPWTVASLAAAMHVSRSGLAAKFRDGVGETPARYLTRWRMTLAADASSPRTTGSKRSLAESDTGRRTRSVTHSNRYMARAQRTTATPTGDGGTHHRGPR